MKLSSALAAPLAVTFALTGTAPAFAQQTNEPENDNVFSCEPQDLTDLSTKEVVHQVMLPATVFVQTMEDNSLTDGPASPGSMEEFLDRFFNQGPDGEGPAPSRLGMGSGVIIDADQGYIVTNNHVIHGADLVTVTLYDPDEKEGMGAELDARVVGTDPETDVAVLQITTDHELTCASFADSSTIEIFDEVIAVGNPLGMTFSVSAGIVSHTGRGGVSEYTDYIQTDATINRGNSGGPSFNPEGNIIGINTFIASPSGGSIGLGFAIMPDTVNHVAQDLIEYGEVQRGWLGVRIQPLGDAQAASLGLDDTDGAYVGSVTEGSPAEAAGIQKGDVILSFNGEEIENFNDLLRAVGRTRTGDTAEFRVWRDGAEQTLSATISSRAEALAEEEPAPVEEAPRLPAPPAPVLPAP